MKNSRDIFNDEIKKNPKEPHHIKFGGGAGLKGNTLAKTIIDEFDGEVVNLDWKSIMEKDKNKK